MEVKSNVQKRRQDRIRELQLRSGGDDRHSRLLRALDRPVSPEPSGLRDRQQEPPLYIRGPREFDHGGDPEVAWKEREKELLEWYSRPQGGFGSQSGQDYEGAGTRAGGGGPARKLILAKTVIAVILFAAVSVVYRLDQPWAQEGKRYIQAALTEDMDFSRVAAWYNETFSGTPSLLPAFGIKQEATKVQGPVDTGHFVQPFKGTVLEAFSGNNLGIWVETRPDAHIAAMDEGRIELAGDRADTGHTVVIQHADGYRTTYGGLKATKWETGDWVKAGDVIGSAAADEEGKTKVFLSVMKDQRYVDPLDVIRLD